MNRSNYSRAELAGLCALAAVLAAALWQGYGGWLLQEVRAHGG